MTAIDNQNPTQEESEEAHPAINGVAGSNETVAASTDDIDSSGIVEADEDEGTEVEEGPAQAECDRILSNLVLSPKKSLFSNWSELHWLAALALVVIALMGFTHNYIQDNKGAVVPVNVYGPGSQCVTQYWHVPDRHMTGDKTFEQEVAAAKADKAADFRRSEPCNIQIVR